MKMIERIQKIEEDYDLKWKIEFHFGTETYFLVAKGTNKVVVQEDVRYRQVSCPTKGLSPQQALYKLTEKLRVKL